MPEANAFSAIPTKILVPIDFSPSAHAALEAAAEIAKHFDAEIHLVHVIPMFTSSTLPDFVPETKVVDGAKKEAERHFAACQKDLAGKGVKVSFTVEVGNDVAGSILDVLDNEHADLVVISTHGVTGWHPLVFGSIAEKVVKLVHVPILLLPTSKPVSSVKVPSGRLMEWW
jgi:nucleotide-binding universal stress UspA family protein